jgi:solute carrier family 25 protein 34/35
LGETPSFNAGEKNMSESPLLQFLMGGSSAVLSGFVTNPLEVAKTRMQLQGELVSRGAQQVLYRNPIQCVRFVWQQEGWRGVQRGLFAASLYQLCMNGVRLGLYDPVKRLIGSESVLGNSLAAAITGSTGAVLANPLYLLKTRLQSQTPHVGGGFAFGYRGARDGMQRVLRNEGIVGLYRGVDAAAARLALGSALQLPLYEETKRKLQAWHAGRVELVWLKPAHLHAAAILLTTFMTTLVTNPLDVVRTRLYAQAVDASGHGTLYRNAAHCAWRVLRSEGVAGLYKGWPAHFLRIGPHAMLTFVIWEQLRSLVEHQ